ncbi:MAG: metallophosphoesterase [Kofleriaceae bacterium]
MKVQDLDDPPLTEVRYLNAGPRGTTISDRLLVLRGTLAGGTVADELDAVVACSDLQGIVRRHDGEVLLGVAVARVLAKLAEDGIVPPTARTGVILAGDLYSVPGAARRGGLGDVSAVWAAFAESFAWVAGVAGNHDDVDAVRAIAGVHLLDTEVVELSGIRIGGVGGIIGNPEKPMRRLELDFLDRMDRVIDAGIELLVLHEGPNGSTDQRGNPVLRDVIEAGGVGLTICGHRHWDDPLAEHAGGQILNVDARVVVLVIRR